MGPGSNRFLDTKTRSFPLHDTFQVLSATSPHITNLLGTLPSTLLPHGRRLGEGRTQGGEKRQR